MAESQNTGDGRLPLNQFGNDQTRLFLIDQLRRSAVSVPSNIAEGDERKSDKDSIRFFHIAKGSLAELATQLEIARDVGYFTTTQVEPLISESAELAKMLGALIRARNSSSPRAQSPAPRP